MLTTEVLAGDIDNAPSFRFFDKQAAIQYIYLFGWAGVCVKAIKHKSTKAQQNVLDSLKQGHEVSGKYIRSIRALEQKGLITNVRCEGKFDPARGYYHEFYRAEIVDLDKLPEPMTFESRVTSNSVQAIFDGEVYYEFKTTAPSVALLLLQTRIVTYHPKRNPSFHGVYYVDGHTIHAVRRESDAPSGKRMMHNWLLNKQVAEDKKRKSK